MSGEFSGISGAEVEPEQAAQAQADIEGLWQSSFIIKRQYSKSYWFKAVFLPPTFSYCKQTWPAWPSECTVEVFMNLLLPVTVNCLKKFHTCVPFHYRSWMAWERMNLIWNLHCILASVRKLKKTFLLTPCTSPECFKTKHSMFTNLPSINNVSNRDFKFSYFTARTHIRKCRWSLQTGYICKKDILYQWFLV